MRRALTGPAHLLLPRRRAEGRTLQAVSGGEHQLVNYNLGPWESWAPHKARSLVGIRTGALYAHSPLFSLIFRSTGW